MEAIPYSSQSVLPAPDLRRDLVIQLVIAACKCRKFPSLGCLPKLKVAVISPEKKR